MTYALGSNDLALKARVSAVNARVAALKPLVDSLRRETVQAARRVPVISYEDTISALKSFVARAAHTSLPVNALRGTMLYGMDHASRLLKGASIATSKLWPKMDPGIVIPNTQENIVLVGLAEDAVSTAQDIVTALGRLASVLRPSTPVSGLGDLDRSIYIVALGILFAGLTSGISIPVSIVVALLDLFQLGDRILSSLSSATGTFTRPVGEAVGDWVRVMLFGGTAVLVGYIGWKVWQAKRLRQSLTE